MKVKFLLIVAIFGLALTAVSCTPESIEDEQTEQQIDLEKTGPPTSHG